jgi:DNA repair protein RecN (Recombination protein N)
MLKQLKIENLAVVEDVVIPFGEGLNTLTGSTGAGKSIILTAVELLSGGRGKRSLIRRGAKTLAIEGLFWIPPEWPGRRILGLEGSDETLTIKREISESGKSRIWINGILSSVKAARETAGKLFELHGQHRQQELLDPSTHIDYLDAWGGHGELRKSVEEQVDEYNKLSSAYRSMLLEDKHHREQEEFLRFQLDELERLDISPGIEQELAGRLSIISDAQTFISNLQGSLHCLTEGDGAAVDMLGRAERHLESLAEKAPSWKETVEELKRIRIELDEISRRIGRSLDGLESGPEDVESLEARLASIQRLKRKYHLDLDGLIGKRDELRGILGSIDGGSNEMGETAKQLEALRRELKPLLEDLSEKRRRSATLLDHEVTEELHRLGMKGALFVTGIESAENNAFFGDGHDVDLSPKGLDRVEFEIRTNIGEAIHPLAEVASGGELSRITLVLKKLQAEESGIPVLIFDEIDAGLGADMGGVVAKKLRSLAEHYQVICITHLAPVAAEANRHIRVSKSVTGDRTVTHAKALGNEERVTELARMLGGRGELRMKLAEELLAEE